jgi:hypothetical protein
MEVGTMKRYGSEVFDWFTSRAEAEECAAALLALDGCIRSGIAFDPFDWSRPEDDRQPWKAYGVFADPVHAPYPINVIPVCLVGRDKRLAETLVR